MLLGLGLGLWLGTGFVGQWGRVRVKDRVVCMYVCM